ncbi:acid sphingomyelinase-like phosphodiesterase 3a [Dreissena polymorpha]|uniref:acid sphingomyelinase-like phosphodiesterase 3a n=1 Tax=Dreissena polymorpha TaxID=45954 RepID=UPI0022644A94|nr:acid sphingomyelinase-like phosphodiesterase 3a [Dreissena polymorpha]
MTIGRTTNFHPLTTYFITILSKDGGRAYYTVKTPHGLRIISLNTNLYYTSDKATVNVSDPADQLQWLNATLVNAKTSNERVLITAHISPGVHTPRSILWMHEKFHTPLADILQTNADIIVGMFFKHDHSDGFKVLPEKTVEYDRTTGRPLDITQYYLDLITANQNATDNWEVEYEATKAYEKPDLTAATLAKLARRIKNPGSKAFKNYWRFYTTTLIIVLNML